MLYLIYSFIFLSLSSPVFAHGGGLNKEGCHNNRKTGEYHCHRGPKAKTKRSSSSNQEVLVGIPKITDGDTIRIGNTRIRFHGIDAPEVRQKCEMNGRQWNCGEAATKALTDVIRDKEVSCSKRDVDRYKRIIAVCRVGSLELNAWMVENGWAVAYRRYSKDYINDEQKAKIGRRGIWRGTFEMPWNWRRR